MLSTPNSQSIPINVVGSSTFGRYDKISAARTYNMLISDDWLVNFAGYKRIYELLPAGEGRGIFRSVRGNFLLAVANANVYRINPGLITILVGGLSSNSGEVTIDENLSNQICIVDGNNAYIYNHSLPPNITTQATGNLRPNYVEYHNTFFLFGNGDNSGNGSAWYAYSFATPTTITVATQMALQTKPDYAIAVKRLPGQSANVIVFGNSVCEVFTQVGGIQNYRRNNTVNIDYGTASVSTIAGSDQYMAWLGINANDSPVILVYSSEGFRPISTDGIDYLMSRIKFPRESTAMFTRIDGHLVYQLTFYNPADNLTILYDFNTQKFFDLSDQHLNYHPAREYAYFDGKIIFISLNNASIYELSTDIKVIDENIVGNDPRNIHSIQRLRVCDTIAQEDSDKFIINVLTMTIEQGQDPNVSNLSLGTIIPILDENGNQILTEAGLPIVSEASWNNAANYVMPYQPKVELSISIDGGSTWSQYVSRELNPIGYRKNILNWNKLGASNSFTPKFRFWGTDRFVVGNASAEIKS